MGKKLDGNYTRMLRAILDKSWRQHPTKQQLCSHLPPITKILQVTRTRYAGHCWRSRDKLISDMRGPLYKDEQRQDDQLEPIYNSSVPIQYVALKTYREWWTIEKVGGRGSGRVISKTQKMVLDTVLLNSQHYKMRMKGKVELFRKRSCALLYFSV